MIKSFCILIGLYCVLMGPNFILLQCKSPKYTHIHITV